MITWVFESLKLLLLERVMVRLLVLDLLELEELVHLVLELLRYSYQRWSYWLLRSFLRWIFWR